MPLDPAVFRDIEAFEFGWEIGLTGSRKRAMQAFVSAPQVMALLNALKDNGDAAYQVANRVLRLVHHPDNDLRYTHPFDVAIAAYLRALGIRSSYLARVVGVEVHLGCKNLWWAVPVVEHILQPRNAARLSRDIVYALEDVEPQQAVVRTTNKAGNNFVSMISSSVQHISRASIKMAASIATGTTLLISEVPPPTIKIDQSSQVESVEMTR